MPKVIVSSINGLSQHSGAQLVDLQTGFAMGSQAVVAAGSDQDTATAISATGGGVVIVTAANNSKGVVLPALADVPEGSWFIINNQVTNKTLEVYPATGDKIFPGADNAGIQIAAKCCLFVWKADATQWVGFEPAIIA